MIFTQHDVSVAERRLVDLKESLAKERGWSPAPSPRFCDMWGKHLPAGKLFVSLDTVIEIERQRDAAAAENMDRFARQIGADESAASAKTREIAEEILRQPAMQERIERATSVGHASQQPPTNPPDGENPRSDVFRLANLAHQYRDKIAVVLEERGEKRVVVYAVRNVIHDVNNNGMFIHICPISEVKRGDAVSG